MFDGFWGKSKKKEAAAVAPPLVEDGASKFTLPHLRSAPYCLTTSLPHCLTSSPLLYCTVLTRAGTLLHCTILPPSIEIPVFDTNCHKSCRLSLILDSLLNLFP